VQRFAGKLPARLEPLGQAKRVRNSGLVRTCILFETGRIPGIGAGRKHRRRSVDREKKKALVAELRQTFDENELLVITHQSGLTVAEASDLRRQMREAGARFKVTKNRLVKLALKGTKFEQLTDDFSGPTAIAVSVDPVAAAKVAVGFADKNDKLTIVAGALGEKNLDKESIKALARLPSLDELRAKIIGVLMAPAGKLASVTQAPASQLARVLNAYATKE